jgi:hypothetical protein
MFTVHQRAPFAVQCYCAGSRYIVLCGGMLPAPSVAVACSFARPNLCCGSFFVKCLLKSLCSHHRPVENRFFFNQATFFSKTTEDDDHRRRRTAIRHNLLAQTTEDDQRTTEDRRRTIFSPRCSPGDDLMSDGCDLRPTKVLPRDRFRTCDAYAESRRYAVLGCPPPKKNKTKFPKQ